MAKLIRCWLLLDLRDPDDYQMLMEMRVDLRFRSAMGPLLAESVKTTPKGVLVKAKAED